jgi:hypothetical protein
MALDFPILSKLGGQDAVHAELTKRGHIIGRDAIRMWRQRGRIPGDAATALMAIAEEMSVGYSSQDFALAEIASAAQ